MMVKPAGRNPRLGLMLLAVLLPGLIAGPAIAGTKTKAKPVRSGSDLILTAQAYADRESLVPGEEVVLAISLKTNTGWHTYWKHPGGTGLPTEFKWTAPDGYQVGETQYPSPRAKHDKVLNDTAWYHKGMSVFLTRVKVPSDATAGKEVTFKVEASWLACKGTCIPGDVELSLSLPVASKGTTAKPANKALFDKAREALPVATVKAKNVTISGKVSANGPFKPEDKLTATLTLDIKSGNSIQPNKPSKKDAVATVIFVEPPTGFYLDTVNYPKASGAYTGKVDFEIVLEAEELDEGANYGKAIRGVVQLQTDKPTAAQYVSFEIPIAKTAQSASAGGSDGAGGPAGEPATVVAAAPSDAGLLQRIEMWFQRGGYAGALGLAFLGGIVLNLMPCVLPVISLKVLSFVRQANEDRQRIFLLGHAYCAGIIVFFFVLSFLYYQWGKGWGELFQRPEVVLGLSALVTAFALSLFGVFALFAPAVVNNLGEKAEGEGLSSAFFTGVLATVLGTACTAPFLSVALGMANQLSIESPIQGASVFMAVGVGMALPFSILSIVPAWLKFVPKAGSWMTTFEVVMGFLLLGTVVWLLNPLRDQIGDYGLLLSLIFLICVGMGVWIKGMVQFGDPAARRVKLNLLALVVIAFGWLLPFRVMATIPDLKDAHAEDVRLKQVGATCERTHEEGSTIGWNPDWDDAIAKGELPWINFDPDRVRAHVEAGYTVFVDFTAGWCLNCKANKKSSLEIDGTIRKMAEFNVVTYMADYTNFDPVIKRVLQSYGSGGVPLYLMFSPGKPDDPQNLGEVLTPSIVLQALEKAGPSKP